MKAAVQIAHGSIEEAISVREIPTPVPGPEDVLIRVRAATLSRKDLFALQDLRGPGMRTRPPLPHVNGADGAGEVAAVGSAVTGWKVGDRVVTYGGLYCRTCEFCQMGEPTACLHYGAMGEQIWGSHAEYVAVPAYTLEAIPLEMEFERAVFAGGAWVTAWRMLVTTARVQPGETVLIVGASGGVGTGGIRIAKMGGCRVIAVVGGKWKAQRALELGADVAVDHTREDFQERALELTGGRGVDIVMDSVGAQTWRKSINSLRMFGRMVICGATSGDSPEISIREVYQRHRQILGAPKGNRTDFRNLLRCLSDGRLEPVIHARLPLGDIHSALRMLQGRDFFGKILVQP